MKIVKIILTTLVIIIAIPLILGLFIDGNYAVQRDITINKPKQDVFNYLKLLRNQDNFSKWAAMDPNMKKDYKGTDGTVGFVTSWDSEKMGKGEQEIKKITEGERIDFELRFFKPMESTDAAYLSTEAISPAQTKVTWGFSGKMKYPLNVLCLFSSMDKMLGKDFEVGLTNLKNILEK
jgi:hypothetical protein